MFPGFMFTEETFLQLQLRTEVPPIIIVEGVAVIVQEGDVGATIVTTAV